MTIGFFYQVINTSFQMTVLMTVCFMIAWTPYAALAFYYVVHDYYDVPPTLGAGL